jgi:Rad52/22 family double-strand break repair protein
MAFTEAQVKSLEAKLDSKHVKTRQVQDTVLAYVEGWHVIAEANRIFGYDAWDRQTLAANCVWTGIANKHHAAAYTAKVRISVRAGPITIIREGCGSGEARALTPGESHELALKAAETDATKRALATFGNPFGLALYDREMAGVRNRKAIGLSVSSDRKPWVLRTGKGDSGQSFDKPDEFAEALRVAMTKATDIELLFAIWEQNVDTVRILNKCLNREGGAKAGLAQSLVAHLKHCAIGLVKPSNQREGLTHQTDSLPGSSGTDAKQRLKIDKSLLTLSEPKRLRSKDHLRFVAHQPCLICGRRPSQAHHVRYAQPRGLRLKVSDEFTVPLCAIHHTENHTTGDERRWWRERNIDPLPVAEQLWRQSNGIKQPTPARDDAHTTSEPQGNS